MELDWELFNSILKRVESMPPGNWLQLDDPLEVEHALLLRDGGLVELLDVSTHDGKAVVIKRLTLQGHNYLNHIRNETVYRKLKEYVAQSGGRFAFDVILALAKKYALGLMS
ncbi:DUF2513 domain-containing protein [Oceanithermus sp.]|uniref:DUF2513 domain-containing protein n=1 Tax=Oceanithermus sp. TaxID=2268145 RepID=UPI0025D59475|nr:DUF2513 domain-containing protein [Oceanithermus sp.]